MTDPLRRQQRSRSADGRAARRWVLVGAVVRRVPNRFPMAMGSDWQIVGHSSAIRQTSPHTVPNKLFQPFPGVSQGYHSCPVVRYLPKSQVAHNPKVAGSNPAPATKTKQSINQIYWLIPASPCYFHIRNSKPYIIHTQPPLRRVHPACLARIPIPQRYGLHGVWSPS
jgi:hypothetical protein